MVIPYNLFILLECKYNKLQFGIRISSIDLYGLKSVFLKVTESSQY